MPKKRNTRDVGNSENFRWTPEDEERKLAARYRAIADRNGFSFSGLTRALICHFVETVEKKGGTIAAITDAVQATKAQLPECQANPRKKAVNYALTEAPPKYGARKRGRKGQA